MCNVHNHQEHFSCTKIKLNLVIIPNKINEVLSLIIILDSEQSDERIDLQLCVFYLCQSSVITF